ncbi:MAG TPA: histidine kinase [Thermoanaerobaculia bacterium]|nr:histidine kinase [Thermoanaerobaculia bacterium]
MIELSETPPRPLRLLGVAMLIVAIWVCFAFFNASEFYRRSQAVGTVNHDTREVIAYQLMSSLNWAVFTPFLIFMAERLPLRRPHRLRNAALILAAAPVLAVIRAALGAWVLEFGEHQWISWGFAQHSIQIRFERNIFLILLIVGITNLVLTQRATAARERHGLALKAAVANAELVQLRAAMQPRFMFATLDAIAARVANRPSIADRMLVHLGHLLRTMLEFGKRGDVSLAEELEVIDRYFEIEKTRTDGRFTTRVDVDEDVLAARVPPLLLHAVVESAMLRAGDASRIEIRGRAEGDLLRLEISNSDPGGIPPQGAVEETRARLRHAFADRTSITWRSENGRVVTELKMPLRVFPEEASA